MCYKDKITDSNKKYMYMEFAGILYINSQFKNSNGYTFITTRLTRYLLPWFWNWSRNKKSLSDRY